MKIQIDIAHSAENQLSALVAAILAYGSLTAHAVDTIVKESLRVKGYDSTGSATKHTMEALKDFPVSMVIRMVSECAPQFTTDELNILIADLNAELYSRRIPADDNPASGVAQTVVIDTSARMGDPASHAGGESVDLASVFAQAESTDSKDDATGEPLPNVTVTVSGVPLDKSGLPWDAKIHSASRAINQTDGLWRQKRGVDPALVSTVTAQLRQAMSVGVSNVCAIVTGGPAIDGVSGVMPDTSGDAPSTVEKFVPMLMDTHGRIIPPPPPRRQATAPAAPTEPQPTSAPAAADTGEIDTFPRLLKFITEQKLAGKLAQAHVTNALLLIGIEGPLPVLQNRPDLIPKMVEKLRAIEG